jgi:poly(3-hydroxybutyrate) depolymerase
MTRRLPALIAACLILAGVAAVHRAQDTAAPELIDAYLNGPDRESAREALRRHNAADVARALREHANFADHEPGVHRVDVQCPDGYQRPMWLRVPEGYDPGRAWPLLVCLHGGVSGAPLEGSGERAAPGEGMLAAYAASLPDDVRETLVLLGPSAGARETHPDAVWWTEQGQHNILHFVTQAKQRLNIDDDRVFVSGFSDGASGSFGLALRMPDTFAGFMPIFGNLLVAGLDGTPIWVENFKGLNIRASNGGLDTLYPTSRMQPLMQQANEAGASIDFADYPDDGHVFSPGGETEVAHFGGTLLSEWRRDLLPATVDWTAASPARGRRAWVVIEEIDSKPWLDNAELEVPPPTARLGVQLVAEQEEPTVESVVDDSAAEAAGVRAGDVIVRLGEVEIAGMGDLRRALVQYSAGDEFTLVVRRGEDELTLSGRFAPPPERPAPPPVSGRVVAEREPGVVTLRARNVRRLSILVAPEMLDEQGRLEVRLISRDGETRVLRPAAEVEPDTEVVLSEHERHGDRNLPWKARLTFKLE